LLLNNKAYLLTYGQKIQTHAYRWSGTRSQSKHIGYYIFAYFSSQMHLVLCNTTFTLTSVHATASVWLNGCGS